MSVITIFLLIASLTTGTFMILRSIKNDNKSGIIKGIFVLIGLLLLTAIQPFSLERIDAGHKGLKVNLTGSERGVSSYQYQTGWVFYNSWTEQVKEFPLFQQHIEYDAQTVITKGGFAATIKPSFNYSLREDAIGEMFTNLSKFSK